MILVTGATASGKSLLLQQLEPLGWQALDGLTPALLPALLPHLPTQPTVAAVNLKHPRDPQRLLDWLHNHGNVPLLLLTARPEILLRRLQGSRRSHPYLPSQGSLLAAILAEWEQVQALLPHASQVWDTSDFLPQDLPAHWQQWQQHRPQPLHITVVSFGYKYGIPRDAHLVFDVRFLPNPYYVPELRPLTGRDPQLQEYIWTFPVSQQAYQQVREMVKEWLPHYQQERRPQLTIAIGCTGGQHRSVTLSERLGSELQGWGYPVHVEHRHLRQSQREIEQLGGRHG
ncbi:MAG: RNase adapter RapZ [Thermostichales cyanobacterium SZTDM-1c_bins_54]